MEKSQIDKDFISAMVIPKSLKEIAFEVVLFSIVVFFTFLATIDILFLIYMPTMSIIASILWLMFIFFQIRGACRESGGIKQYKIRIAGIFAWREFAEISRDSSGRKVLSLGYKLFGKRLYCLKVLCDGIKTVDWSMGQASGITGRDMNDWHVVIWFDEELSTTLDWTYPSKSKYGLYIIGPSQKKENAVKLGDRLISFLIEAGVSLRQHDKIT